jgi:hypothetical protein
MTTVLLTSLALVAFICLFLYKNRERFRIHLSPHLLERFLPNALFKPTPDKRPVFFIGFYKTGTNYYSRVFESLGFKVMHDSHWRGGSIKIIEQYDVFNDACLHDFKTMHHAYPGAKFILNTRPLRPWLISRLLWIDELYRRMNQFERKLANPVVRLLWGNDSYYDQSRVVAWIHERRAYHKSVVEFFQGKPGKLLVLDLEDSEKLKQLGDFLNLEFSAQAREQKKTNVSKPEDKEAYSDLVDSALSVAGIKDAMETLYE